MKPISIRGTRLLGRVAALLSALALVAVFAPAAAAPTASAAGSAPSCPWLDSSLSVSARVQMLLKAMTLPDKINLVTGAGFSEPYVFFISGNPTSASRQSVRRMARSASVTASPA